MKRVVLIATCLLITVVALAQTDGDFQMWMQNINSTCGSLKKNLEAKKGKAAAADAQELHTSFADVHAFFKKKNTEDAMKFAMAASEGFDKLAAQAAAGKFDAATATFKATTANCGGCHSAHREKAADGTFKIRY